MKKFLAISTVMLVAVSCSKKPELSVIPTLPENILATVDDVQITVEDFESFALERNAPDTAEARMAVMDEMITQEVLLNAAKKEGLDQTPEFHRAMRQFLITRLEEKKMQPLLAQADEVSEPEIDQASRESALRFVIPAARRYAWLRVQGYGGETTEAAVRIQSALSNFRSLPEDLHRIGFGSAAAEFSDDGDTRYQGGDLGWLTPEQLATRLPPETASQALRLKPGQTSDPIQLPDGVCVIRCGEERPATPIPKNDFRQHVKQQLITRRRAEARSAFLASSRKALKVEIHQEKLKSIRKPPP